MGTGFVINVRIKLSLYQMIAIKRGFTFSLVVSVYGVYISYLIYVISIFYAVFDVNVGLGLRRIFISWVKTDLGAWVIK